MIVVKLFGGLGNQMFQYAAARGAIQANQPVYLDCSAFEDDTANFTTRPYELHIFQNLNARKAANWRVNLLRGKAAPYKLIRGIFSPYIKYLHHPGTADIPLSDMVKNKLVYVDGYFQSENYFKHYRENIIREFQFPQLDAANELWKTKIISASQSVSLHIRRGDYVTWDAAAKTHGVLPLNYYHQALSKLNANYPGLKLFVFSDDIHWAKNNLQFVNNDIQFVSDNSGADSWKDMVLMTHCKHHIIANSSFSWWGAWLSENNGKVYAPYRWFNPLLVTYNINDIVPSSWTIVEYD